MKKVLLMLVIIFSIGVVDAKVIEAGKETTYYFSTSKNIVKEVMKDYYLRGDNIQYHESRGKYDSKPEEATSQDRQFQVCSVFYYNTLNTSFGMSRYNKNKIGIGPQIMADARKYYEKMQSNSKLKNGQYLIYYEKAYSTTDENGKITDPKKKYVYGFVDAKANDKGNYEDKTEVDANDFIKILQPGDIIFYKSRTNSGHYIVVYDFVKNSNGETDVLFLNSNGSTSIPSRLYGVKRLYYDYNTKNKGFFGAAVEGTVKYGYLMDVDGNSISKNIIKNKGDKKILSCGMEECTIVRPFFESDNKKTVFNYDIDTEAYLSSYLRTQYPGMVIEKTVDKVDNNSVYPEDTLTYTIKITNKSGNEYNPFTIKETIDSKVVEYKKCEGGCTKSKSGNEITWQIDKLEVGKTKTITYTVKVKTDTVGKTINATGEFKCKDEGCKNASAQNAYITTGTVSNKVIPNVTVEKNNSYSNCYEKLSKSYQRKTLINEIYKCVWNKDYSIDKLDFTDLFSRSRSGNKMNASFKTDMSSISKIFKNMILNDYWSIIVNRYGYNGNEKGVIEPFSWNTQYEKETIINRKRAINEGDFKDGDVLIYYVDYNKCLDGTEICKTATSDIHTKENGYYAYIYIKGSFVGVNYPGKSNERNKFTYEYYKDLTINNTTGYASHLYKGYNHIEDDKDLSDRLLKIANYETLIDKEYYVILRPEIVIAQDQSNKSTPAPTNSTVAVTSIKLDKTSLSLKVNETATLKATVSPSNATDKTVTWTSSNTTIATVSNGKITAKKAGTVTITAKSGNKATTCTVTVSGSSSTITPIPSDPVGVKPIGDVNGDGNVTVLDYIAIRKHRINLIILTGDKLKRADVNGDGKVSNLDYLKIREIILTEASKKDVKGLTLNKTKVSIKVGESVKIVSTIIPGDAKNKKVTYKSNNTSIAIVDSNGNITGKGKGKATITATTYNGISKTVEVTVTTTTVAVTSIELNKSRVALKTGESVKLVPTISPSNATDKKVTYKSSDTSIATVDANGKVTVKGKGDAVITATTSNGKTAKCTVTTNIRILFVGNSKTFYNMYREFTLNIAISNGYEFIGKESALDLYNQGSPLINIDKKEMKNSYYCFTQGGKSLQYNYETMMNSYKSTMSKLVVDYVILQEQTTAHSNEKVHREGITYIVKMLAKSNPDIKVFIRNTWLNRNTDDKTFNDAIDLTKKIVAELNNSKSSLGIRNDIKIINDGEIIWQATKKGLNAFCDDAGHPSYLSSYATALATNKALFNITPSKNVFLPDILNANKYKSVKGDPFHYDNYKTECANITNKSCGITKEQSQVDKIINIVKQYQK